MRKFHLCLVHPVATAWGDGIKLAITRADDPSVSQGIAPAQAGELQESFLVRLRTNATDRTLIANPLVAGVFCLFRWLHLIAREPYWVYVVVVLGGGLASVLCSTLIRDPTRSRVRMNVHVAVNMAIIGVVAYSTGWGPILSIGFLFGAAASIQVFGSKSTWPCVIYSTVAIGLGQLAVAGHIAPTLVRPPLVYGVACLGLVGTVLVEEFARACRSSPGGGGDRAAPVGAEVQGARLERHGHNRRDGQCRAAPVCEPGVRARARHLPDPLRQRVHDGRHPPR